MQKFINVDPGPGQVYESTGLLHGEHDDITGSNSSSSGSSNSSTPIPTFEMANTYDRASLDAQSAAFSPTGVNAPAHNPMRPSYSSHYAPVDISSTRLYSHSFDLSAQVSNPSPGKVKDSSGRESNSSSSSSSSASTASSASSISSIGSGSVTGKRDKGSKEPKAVRK